MGPNGTGKSTLSKAIAGHPDYQITSGEVLLDGRFDPGAGSRRAARARAFSSRSNIRARFRGVSIANFLRAAQQARMSEGEDLDASAYYKRLYSKMDLLKIDRKRSPPARSTRAFPGGEKKRCEILQMAMLEPKFALMDRRPTPASTSMRCGIVADGVNSMLRGPNLGVLLITHYQRLLDYIVPDYVHVAVQGRPHREERRQVASRSSLRGQGLRPGLKKELCLRLSPLSQKTPKSRSVP